jgi:hypothetical protein
MEKQLNNQDINNILTLIGNAQVKGSEAVTVALLQQKLSNLITPEVTPLSEKPTEPEEKSKK